MQSIINAKDIVYRYPQASKPILEGVSLILQTGEIVSLLGANGCGKSTLLKLIVNDISPLSGAIQKKEGLKIAYISQNMHQSLFMELTVQENLILMGVKFKTKEEAEDYLSAFHKNLFLYGDQPVNMLSGGEKQALILAIKLYGKPDLLLLDEHTSAMDPEAEKNLMQLTYQKIIEQKITTLMCTHKVSIAKKYSTRIIGLNKGKIIIDLKNKDEQILEETLNMIYY